MTDEQTLDEFFCEGFEEDAESERREISRRQFLRGGLTGGAVGLTVAAGTGAAVWKLMDADAQAALAKADAEMARLQGLVSLYEDLEKVGLDAILQAGMAAVALPLEVVRLGADALRRGLDLFEGVLRSMEEALPSAQEALLWLEDRISALADGVERVERALGDALEKATDNPVAQALEDLAHLILDKLPFGLGEQIRNVFEGLVKLVTGVDDLIKGINTALLEPLREKWFDTEQGKGIGATLIDPLIVHILDPLEAHLSELGTLADTWQARLLTPAQKALEDRARILDSIAQYRQQHGLG